jgi:4-hydroxythreonine-4-phosphate dehydrogenase
MQKPPLALTQGDPAGIGLEIALKSWLLREEKAVPAFVLLSDPGFVEARAHQLGLAVPVVSITSTTEASLFHKAFPVLPTGFVPASLPGQPRVEDCASTRVSIEQGVALVLQGEASALVTNPIAKSVLKQGGFAFPGHTEFLEVLAGSGEAVMMLWCQALAVVPVTVHIPLSGVPERLSTDAILRKARIVAAALRDQFGIVHPRLAITGLNPHAGESGTMGDEEIRLILPAIHDLQKEGLSVTGPHPADTLFHEKARKTYDAVIAMYHDQALIPIKTLAFDDAVNVTLGLPFLRTSPDHGTAFDIASKGAARPDSLIQALKLAAKLSVTDVSDISVSYG